MKVERDDHGQVTSVELSIDDIRRRKLLYRKLSRVHPLLRDEVKRHQEAHLEALRRNELRDRYRDHPRGGCTPLWAEIQARMAKGEDV
jgi:hypothetical protein